jgi:S-adenosylmethionine hydrolase
MRSTIALLTDFGWRDPYVGSMKAVIAARSEARIVDLGHDIDAGDVFGGAVFLAAVAPYFGRSTVVVAVVDPGVGTDRPIIVGEVGSALFLAPDNGLLTLLPIQSLRRVESSSLFLPEGSNTFHGRDRFAPVAAALAEGAPLESVGPLAEEMVRLPYSEPSYQEERAVGSVIAIDRFGNAVTDLEARRLRLDRTVKARVKNSTVDRIATNYQQLPSGPFLIVGSRGTIEISASGKSAAELLQIARFDRVELVWS